MVSAKSIATILVLLTTLFGVSSAVFYKVGDENGWTSKKNFDYKTWASSKKFRLGDLIHFEYDPKVDNVVRVTHLNFRACNATNPISVINTGNDTILVRNPHSHLYYISSAPGHCEAGQKVDIRVYRPSDGSGETPSPSNAAQPLGFSTIVLVVLAMGVHVL